MPVSEVSISALTSPETRAKSLATRQRNKESRDALKQRIATEKLDKETDGLVSQLKNQVANESVLTNKLTNSEFQIKNLEVKQDAIKEQVLINTSSIKDLSTKLHTQPPMGYPHYPPPQQPPQQSMELFLKKDIEELQDKVKTTNKSIKKNFQTIQTEIDRIDESAELSDTHIAHLQMQMKEMVSMTQKINTLFSLVYNNTTNRTQLDQYCHIYECPVQHVVSQPRAGR